MRRALLLLFVATSAAAQSLTIDVTKDREFAIPGRMMGFTVLARNPGSAPATATYQNRVFLSTNIGAIIRAVTTDHRDVKCRRVGIIGSDEVYDCSCTTPNITVPAGGAVKTDVTVDIPTTAAPGATFTLGTTLNWGTSGTIGRTISIAVASNPSPKLSVKINRDKFPDYNETVLFYDIEVTNVGDSPTTGPIDVDVTYRAPGRVEQTKEELGGGWSYAGSVLRARFDRVLQPGETLKAPRITHTHRPIIRGTYELTALAAGGGSPPDQKKDVFVVAERVLSNPTFEDVLDFFTGRPR